MTIKRKSPDEEDEEDAEAADAVAAAMGDDDMMDTTTGNVVTTHETQQDQHQVQHQVQQHTNTMQPEHHQEHHHQDTTTDHHHHQVSVPMEEDQEQQQQQQHHHHHVDTNNEQDPLSATKRPAVGGDAQWNAMLFQLIYYKAIHGDLRPKAKEEEHKPLYDWMVAQRKEFKIYQETPDKSYLTTDQVKVLDHLQFPWNTRGDEHWFRNYEHLKQFRKEHGHCMVPRTFVDVPNLCHWVTDQRRQLKNLKSGKPSTMTKDRQRLLDEIGFVWQVRNRTTWDTRFAELMEFKEQKGTTVVPQREYLLECTCIMLILIALLTYCFLSTTTTTYFQITPQTKPSENGLPNSANNSNYSKRVNTPS